VECSLCGGKAEWGVATNDTLSTYCSNCIRDVIPNSGFTLYHLGRLLLGVSSNYRSSFECSRCGRVGGYRVYMRVREGYPVYTLCPECIRKIVDYILETKGYLTITLVYPK